jgi:hypothetical protein
MRIGAKDKISVTNINFLRLSYQKGNEIKTKTIPEPEAKNAHMEANEIKGLVWKRVAALEEDTRYSVIL